MPIKFLSPLTWVGGKAKKWKTIKNYFPKETKTLVDCFVGGGSVSLNYLNDFSNGKVIANDIDEQLINFWEWLSQNNDPIEIPSFSSLAEAKKFYDKQNCPMKFFLDNALTYGGYYKGSWSELRLKQNLSPLKVKRLNTAKDLIKNRVEFNNEDYSVLVPSLIANYKVKKEDTLFFFDPPYSYNQKMKVYKHYKFDFVSFRMLIDKLDEAGYKFLITIDNSPEIRNLFKDYNLHDEEWKYTSSNTHNCEVKTGKELFITNYEPKR